MTDDVERRLRDGLRAERLPDAPPSLRAFIERLPAAADSVSLPPIRSRILGRTGPSLAAAGALVLVALTGLWVSLNPQPVSGPGPHPSPAARLAHYQGGLFAFDYPIEWRVISGLERFGHGPTVLAAVGIGDFDLGCVQTANALGCGTPIWTVPGDGVVVAYYATSWRAGVSLPIPSLGPREGWVEVGGRLAVESRTANTLVLQLNSGEIIEARWGVLNAEQSRADVDALVASWEWTSFDLTITCEDQPAQPPTPLTCERTLAAVEVFMGTMPAWVDRRILSKEFHFGEYCRPGARCLARDLRSGYVVFTTFEAAPPEVRQYWIRVAADDAGVVTVTSDIEPFPPGDLSP